VVIGTAGHVDHGKSALVRALTGTDPDRLAEEKARGLTIDLGFAWTELPDGGVASFVDVPGHEDFVRNMLAGAGGMDAVLLVVAADEGPMPQTREHTSIVDLLGIAHGVVALTKMDLVDDEWLALVQQEVVEGLAGTALAGAAIVPVSATRGDGLGALREELARLIRGVPPAQDRGRPRMAVDRAFTLAGFGTVVTGTLRDGSLLAGDTLELLPTGLRCRARSVQSHGRAVERALPGRRTAVNLAGLAASDVRRGDVVTRPEQYVPTRLIDLALRVLPDAPAPVRHDAQAVVFHGAAEVPAHVRVIGARSILPGDTGPAQLRLARPIVVCAGDRLVIRQPSPARTIGGGVVLCPHPRSRWRRHRAPTARRFSELASGRATHVTWHALAQHEPCPAERLRPCDTGLEADRRAAALDELVRSGRAVRLGALWITDSGWASLADRARAALAAYHETHPLRSGMAAEELRARLALAPEAFAAVCARAADEGWLLRDGASVRAREHGVELSAEQQAAADRLLARYKAAPFRPPSAKEAEAAVGPAVLTSLLERGDLVAVGGDVLFDRATYDALRQAVLQHLRSAGRITVADVRDRFDTSRRYALALLEHLDRTRLTRRTGDVHVLAGPAAADNGP